MDNICKKWYVIHTYSGYEKKVKADLEMKLENSDVLKQKIFNVVVPEEEVIEVKRGKEKKVMKKLFTSYVMVELEVEREEDERGVGFKVDSDVWYVLRNTIGVTGFLGVGNDPIPLDEDEVRKLGLSTEITTTLEKIDLPYDIGTTVSISGGAFVGNSGEVLDIDYKNRSIKIEVDIFGRKTPVSIKMEDVEA